MKKAVSTPSIFKSPPLNPGELLVKVERIEEIKKEIKAETLEVSRMEEKQIQLMQELRALEQVSLLRKTTFREESDSKRLQQSKVESDKTIEDYFALLNKKNKKLRELSMLKTDELQAAQNRKPLEDDKTIKKELTQLTTVISELESKLTECRTNAELIQLKFKKSQEDSSAVHIETRLIQSQLLKEPQKSEELLKLEDSLKTSHSQFTLLTKSISEIQSQVKSKELECAELTKQRDNNAKKIAELRAKVTEQQRIQKQSASRPPSDKKDELKLADKLKEENQENERLKKELEILKAQKNSSSPLASLNVFGTPSQIKKSKRRIVSTLSHASLTIR